MRLILIAAATLSATTVQASIATPVPELSAVGATAAIAGVAAVIALVKERRNRRD